METWTKDQIPPLLSKTALITDGIAGSGLEIARELALNGMKVVLCVDDVLKGEQAMLELRSMHGAEVSYEHVDFADLYSVNEFCSKFKTEHEELHLLVNNAELKNLPQRMSTAQGHEMMFGYNYLSHFLLTSQLFELLVNAENSHIIFTTSNEYQNGEIDFFDLEATHFYEPHKAYAQSKLALIIFARELDRRLRITSLDVKSIPVLQDSNFFWKKLLSNQMFQYEALPVLFAATDSEAKSGNFYGVKHGLKGPLIEEIDFSIQAKNLQAAEKLWEISQEYTGCEFALKDMSNVLPFHLPETKTQERI